MRKPAAAAFLLAVLSCARMMAPGGGPEDLEPPVIVSVQPEPGAGQPDIREITVTWSERLAQGSAAVFIYPFIEHSLDVKGNRMIVSLAEAIGPNPVVVHLPSEISDRRGNSAGYTPDLVYSSADSLPGGSLRLALQRQGGGNLAGNTIIELRYDSVLVRRLSPDSSAVTEIQWLQDGEYSLLCYEDPDRSFYWRPDTEAGMDTVFTVEQGDSVYLEAVLTVVDTVGPFLNDIAVLDSYHVQLYFNEEVSYQSFSAGSLQLLDSLEQDLPVMGYWLPGGATGSAMVLETARLPRERLMLHLDGVQDLMENSGRRDSMEFFGVDTLPSDSLRVRSYFPAPGSDNADPAGPFLISFNYWVHPDSLAARFSLTRVTDSTLIEGEISASDGRSFEFRPADQLIGEQQYRFLLEPGIHTAWGDTLLSPFSWTFSPVWGDEPGSIAGTVSGTSSSLVVLRVSRTGGGGDNSVIYAPVSPGDYRVDEIPPGRYTVAAFIDSDGDRDWSPWEPYGTYPGIVLVQPGLISREVNIDILP